MKTTIKSIYSVLAAVTLAIGAVTANGTPGDLFASINGGNGNGDGFIYQYTPDGVQTTFASGLSRPRGLAFDSEGNLFVATNSGDNLYNATILKITADGTQNVFAIIPVFVAQGVAIDRSDNVFVMMFTNQFHLSKIYKFTPDGKEKPFAILPSHPFSQSFGLAFDNAGNLFAASYLEGIIYKFAPDGTRTVFLGESDFGPEIGPIGLAFDHFGNLFVSTATYPFGNDTILKFTPSGVKSTFAIGLDGPRGLVFDSAGNLFVAEVPLFTTGDILKFTPDGMRTVFASGIGDLQGNGGPEFLAIQP